jgi:hypothetical protein
MQYLPKNVSESALRNFGEIPPDLPERAREVLARKLAGVSNRRIARALNVDEKTVRNDIRLAFPDGRVPVVTELAESFALTIARSLISTMLAGVDEKELEKMSIKDRIENVGKLARFALTLTAAPPVPHDPEDAVNRLASG